MAGVLKNVVPINVLLPDILCTPTVTTPPNEALAGSKFNTFPVNVAAFAFGVEPIADNEPKRPLVPEEPLDPEEPDEPLVPVLPEVPVVPEVPEVPVVPLVPDVPLVPEVPLDPEHKPLYVKLPGPLCVPAIAQKV